MWEIKVTRQSGEVDTLLSTEDRNLAIAYYNAMLVYWRKSQLEWQRLALFRNKKEIAKRKGESNETKKHN